MPLPPERTVRLAVGDVTLTIDLAAGARAAEWSVAGHDVLARHGDGPVHWGMYPMAPWAGRLRGNQVTWNGREHPLPITYEGWALHGTVLAQPATVIEEEHGAGLARVVARIEEHPGWPWPTAVDIAWELRPRLLTTRITVHALAEPMPAVVGWHPWFRRDLGTASVEWSLRASQRVVRGPDHLPTAVLVPYRPEDGPFDDAFLATEARVRWPGLLAIDVVSDGGWFVVFDELPDAVCIEPQSGPPDGLRAAFGQDVPVASPGSPVVLESTWTISDDPPGDRG